MILLVCAQITKLPTSCSVTVAVTTNKRAVGELTVSLDPYPWPPATTRTAFSSEVQKPHLDVAAPPPAILCWAVLPQSIPIYTKKTIGQLPDDGCVPGCP